MLLKVLIVEDDPIISKSLLLNLAAHGYEVRHSPDLKQSFELNQKEKLDLILLDLNLPDGHGFQLLKAIRQKGSRIPIIILTAQTHEDTVVEGLQLGASDYIRKPFGSRELLARIKAALHQPQIFDQKLRFNGLQLLLDKRKVLLGSKEIEVSKKEFEILKCLIEKAESVVSRESLLQKGIFDLEVVDRTIDSHISHIRQIFKKFSFNEIKITSIYGIGYRLEKNDDSK